MCTGPDGVGVDGGGLDVRAPRLCFFYFLTSVQLMTVALLSLQGKLFLWPDKGRLEATFDDNATDHVLLSTVATYVCEPACRNRFQAYCGCCALSTHRETSPSPFSWPLLAQGGRHNIQGVFSGGTAHEVVTRVLQYIYIFL